MRLGISTTNPECYAIGDDVLHCGDCFGVRIEYGDDWYLVEDNKKYEMSYYSVTARFHNSKDKYIYIIIQNKTNFPAKFPDNFST